MLESSIKILDEKQHRPDILNLIKISHTQELDINQIYWRIRKNQINGSRVSWRLTNFAYSLSEYMLKNGYNSEAFALREACAEYIAAASPLAVQKFLEMLSAGIDDYLFQRPRNESGLTPFVKFSDAEPKITAAHPDLIGKKRLSLYAEWRKKSPDSFLALKKSGKNDKWEPIAVSIILPITKEGHKNLLEENWDIQDRTNYIAPPNAKPASLLLDTWIVKKSKSKFDSHETREPHQRWAIAMIFRHLALFSEPDELIDILVEPDFDHIKILCKLLGLNSHRRDGIFVFNYNDQEHTKTGRMLFSNINASRSWDILK